jgi:hypothetical protein
MVDETATPVVVFWLPGSATTTAAVTLHVTEMLPVTFFESFAVTVATDAPAAEGAPEIAPVLALMDTPAGRPVADQLYGDLPPVADIVSDTATPVVQFWLP